MDISFSELNFNSVETLPGCEARAALTVNSATVSREDVEKRNEIVRQVKAQVVGYLRSGSFNSRKLADIVNYIRLNAEAFGECHQAETAKLFAPPVFSNEKKSSGYFF